MPLSSRSLFLISAFAAICLLSCSAFSQNDDDLIKIDSTIVTVNTYVTDKNGKAVGGLRDSDFSLFEDGQQQLIESFSAESTPFAAVILLDISGSMEERVTLARSAAIQFLNGMRSDDTAAILSFDSKVKVVRDFSAGDDLPDRFFDLRSNGMTALNDAIFEASVMLSKRAEKRRAIIVLSDGEDTFSNRSSDKALKAASAVGATIYTVDMSDPQVNRGRRVQNVGALKNFAEKTGGTFVATPGGLAMRSEFIRIVNELSAQFTLVYSPKEVKRDGKFHNIEVRISRPGLTIRARKGYIAPKN